MRRLAIAAFLLGAAVALAHRPFSQIVRGDSAIYDYIAQAILRGQLPYRDVIDPKAPASMYLSAAAMAIGNTVGMRDVIAVRWLHVFMMGCLSAIIYLVAVAYLRDRRAAVIAFLIPLLTDHFTLMMLKGTQPKLPMMIFGMLSLLLIAKGRPFWAGVCSMLACLCWQPGLMFTGVAFLIFSRYLTRWRDGRALKVIAGAAVPLAAVLIYFYAKGALADLWSWTITYTYSVFGPESEKPLRQAWSHFLKMTRQAFHRDLIFVALSIIGLVMYGASRLREILKGREALQSAERFRDAILIPPAVYFVFCMINFQGAPDLIPFLPFIGLFAGWFIVETGRLIAASRWASVGGIRIQWDALIPGLAVFALLALIVVRAAIYRPGKWTLQEQDRAVQEIANYLGPQDQIYVHGTAEILVLLNRPNLNRYIALDTGADNYIAAHKPGGFKDVIDEIEAAAPKLAAISRLRNVRHSQDLEQWVEQHYDPLGLPRFKRLYIRKPQ